MDIAGVRMDIEDNIDVVMGQEKYKVRDLVEFLQSLDQNRPVIWSGVEKHRLILIAPITSSSLFICEAIN